MLTPSNVYRLPLVLPSVLKPLMDDSSWVIWRRVKRGGEWTKPPYTPGTTNLADISDPTTWGTYAAARRHLTRMEEKGGLGYVLQTRKRCGAGALICGIDLDDCVGRDGRVTDWARELIEKAVGAYIEYSPSGTGLHIIGWGKRGKISRRIEMNGGGHVEVYRDAVRYLTVTGRQFGECMKLINIDALIDELAARKSEGGGKDKSESGIFHKKVCELIERRSWDVDQIMQHIDEHPKYWDGCKLSRFARREGGARREVQRSYDRWVEEHADIVAQRNKWGELKWAHGSTPSARSIVDVCTALTALGVMITYDTFHEEITMSGGPLAAGPISDYTALELRMPLWTEFRIEPSTQIVNDALLLMAQNNKVDPVQTYLLGLKWDGVRRLDKWVVTYLGCENNALNRAVGRLSLIAGVRRVLSPGCKFDNIIVLEGPEGISKSSAIELLAGRENFSDQSILGLSDRQQQEALQGVWLYEIADLRGIRHTDVEHIKAFASRTVDRARPAYGKLTLKQARRCVLFASTNEDEYLKGVTGNRRWWPLQCGTIDIEALRRDRDQLWAEAVVCEREQKSLTLPSHLWAAARVEQEKRLERDPWEDMLSAVKGRLWRNGEEERISSRRIYSVLGLRASEIHPGTGRRIGHLMRKLGWVGPIKDLTIVHGTDREKGYWRKIK